MCGIAAILAGSSASVPVDGGELLRMRERMIARGPDGAGLWLSPHGLVGLAHRRLAILDLSEAGAQPMASECGRFRLVFNGEIYNHRELRAGLEAEGARFRSHSDTEVILALYARRGRAMLDSLRGMFAIALWDEEKQGLLLARDHFGIKPLYVADDGRTLRAASQVKALLAGGGIGTAPDPAGHAGFFLWGHVPEPHTLYRAIRPLPAGSWLWAGADGRRDEGRFFDFRRELADARAGQGDLRAALAESVRLHLEADVPVGVFLSAGLDSTTLAALAREAAPLAPRTVTLGFAEFEGSARDEVPLAELVAAHYGTDHQTHRVTGAEFAACRDRILEDMDQPSVDGVNTWFVARAAARAGLKVALSGLGGDELFAGYNDFTAIPKLVRTFRPFQALPGLGRLLRQAARPWIGRVTSPKAAGLAEYGGQWAGAYLLRRGLVMPWELDKVLDPDMARAGLDALAPLTALGAASDGIGSDRLKITALETAFYMRNQLLRDSDWAGMAHSLEIRTPLVDIGLFRAVLPLIMGADPPGKRQMACSARPPLPAPVMERAKTGFFVPVAQWLGEKDLRGWAGRVYRAFGQP
ncbi:asparagine synthase [Paramagnetospirillum caucaseum]|uniref:asparagine synthase (glutamine-hydrolyzing) n=1 Tax=Paramagnetospirillum caucaseum TaxID=1244869 RepID=M2Z4P7_9PROT|nr:asparagine synthase (glutamine-hydrolyzing) [Paramagnetospirillum caucaseum]EME69335.1 asparagine synthase [Paramagnetospirillum caucaseum]